MNKVSNFQWKVIEKEDKKNIINFIKVLNEVDNLEATVSEEMLDYFLSKPNFKDSMFLIYEEGKLIGIGTCISSGTSKYEGGFEVYVHPKFRRMGIEDSIYDILVKKAKEKKLRKVTASSNEDIEYLRSLFERNKFKEYEYMWHMKLPLRDKKFESLENNELSFVKTDIKDLSRFTDLMNDGFREGKEGKYTEEALENKFSDPNTDIYLLKKDDELIACTSITFQEEMSIGYISGLAVYKIYRGKGFGQILLNLSIRKIKERGLDTASLHVVGTNESALKLYKKSGFDECGKVIRYEKEF
ncbi:MAG: GNAT family N-acetyltransferase [Firmicutes bacterium]|nr:GNAT family N-acetyltransferase [Bacillota bacterium]